MGKVAHIFLIGPVGIFPDEAGNLSGFTIDSVISQVQAFKGQDIERYNFKIKGPGGFVDEGNAIHDYMASLRKEGVSISTEQVGDIGSIDTKLFLAPDPSKGEKRLVDEKFKFMIHNPWGEFVGNADELKEAAEELEEVEKDLRNFYVQETGITEEGLKPLMDKESEMSAKQAVAFGFATGFVGEPVQNKIIAIFKPKSNTMSKDNQSTLDKIKALLSKIKMKDDDIKAIDFTMEGGTVLRVDAETEDAVVGANAVIIDAEGQETTAPEGDHILDDGRIVSIDANGVVMEIREAEETTEEETDEALLKKENEELKATIKELEKFKTDFEGKMDEKLEAEMKEVNEKVTELTEGLKEVDEDRAQLKAMRTVYGVKADRNFVKEIDDDNKETEYDVAKARLAEKRKGKKAIRGQVKK